MPLLRLALAAVVLEDADQAVARRVDHAVGVAMALGVRQRPGLLARLGLVEPLVGEVGEVDGAVMHDVVAAAVLVHARAGVERRRVDVLA